MSVCLDFGNSHLAAVLLFPPGTRRASQSCSLLCQCIERERWETAVSQVLKVVKWVAALVWISCSGWVIPHSKWQTLIALCVCVCVLEMFPRCHEITFLWLFVPLFLQKFSFRTYSPPSASLQATNWSVWMDQGWAYILPVWKQCCLFARCHVLTTPKGQVMLGQEMSKLYVSFFTAVVHICVARSSLSNTTFNLVQCI